MAFGSQANLPLRALRVSARFSRTRPLYRGMGKGAHSRQAVEAETSKSAVC